MFTNPKCFQAGKCFLSIFYVFQKRTLFYFKVSLITMVSANADVDRIKNSQCVLFKVNYNVFNIQISLNIYPKGNV